MINEIRDAVHHRDITIQYFTSDWCPMCLRSNPILLKMFKDVDLNEEKLDIHFVNTRKTEPKEPIEKYNISRVPTVVVLENGKEIGRIVEYEQYGWIGDVFKIVVGK